MSAATRILAALKSDTAGCLYVLAILVLAAAVGMTQ